MICVLLAACCAAAAARAESYGWPLDSERALSSSFGEYRDGHYHAGVDLRTFGQIGLPCRAIDACEAARIRVSPWGYGKALYLRLRDGRTAVYAHLNGFSRGLDSLTYHWQLQHAASICDITLEPGLFAFEQGDVVAFTGNTGALHPHLHFEIRDSDGRPLNPLESLYEVPDGCDPVISGLEIVPLAWGSLVNGSPLPRTYDFHRSRGGTYEIADTLRLDGVFGFGVSAYDKQMMGSYRMGPYAVELRIDDVPAYRVRNSSFDYARTSEILLEYDERGGDAPGRYLALYEKGRSRAMPGREGYGIVRSPGGEADSTATAPGIHRGEIIVRDANGNEAKGIFYFLPNAGPDAAVSLGADHRMRIAIVAADPDGGGVSATLSASLDEGKSWRQVALTGAREGYEAIALRDSTALYRVAVRDDEGALVERYFAAPPRRDERDSVFCEVRPEVRAEGLLVTLAADRPLASIPAVYLAGAAGYDTLTAIPLDARESVVFVPAERLSSGVAVLTVRGRDTRGFPLDVVRAFQIIVLESGGRESFKAGEDITVLFGASSVRGRGVVLLGEAPVSGEGSAELETLAPPFSIDFAPASFSRGLQCGIQTQGKAGLYRSSGKRGEWRCVGISGSDAAFALGRPGIHAVMRDMRAPDLKRPASARRGPGSGFFKPRLYYVSVNEEGSGVDAGSGAVFIDGVRAVCEWDDYRARLEIPVPRSRAAGPAVLRVELADRAGNRSVGEFDFVID